MTSPPTQQIVLSGPTGRISASAIAPPDTCILLNQARSGMVLSRTVELPNRTRLCPSGTTLSDGLIQRLAGRGIKRIYIVGTPSEDTGVDNWAEKTRKLHERFSRVKNQPYLLAIMKSVENALARKA
jgi:hypothetical protein